jgi:nucleoside-diphosphate-sugar epimerase
MSNVDGDLGMLIRDSTGITGYIGGQTVVHLTRKYPELEIIALVRNLGQAETVKSVLPHVKTVIGDLDSVEILKKQSVEADIVLRMHDQFPPMAPR